jgi:hypothetical protein
MAKVCAICGAKVDAEGNSIHENNCPGWNMTIDDKNIRIYPYCDMMPREIEPQEPPKKKRRKKNPLQKADEYAAFVKSKAMPDQMNRPGVK